MLGFITEQRRAARPSLVAATLLSLGSPATSLALDPDKGLGECTVRVWRAADGLASNRVHAVVQSADGYLWIGTRRGLSRFDGELFVRVDANDVRLLLARRGGALWVGLAYGDPLSVEGEEMRSLVASGAGLPEGLRRVRAAHQDGEGFVWAAGDQGVFRIDDAGATSVLALPPRLSVATLSRDARGRLWLGGEGGLFVWSPGDGTPVPAQGAGGAIRAAVRAILQDRAGRLWVGAGDELLRLDGERLTAVQLQGEGPGVGPIAALLEDRHGSLWIAGATGLARLRDQKERYERYATADGLPDADVTALHQDREGSLWVGTRTGGLAQFTDRTLSTAATPPALRDADIRAVCEDADGALWLGARGRRLSRWKDGTLEELGDRISGSATALYPRPDGGVWIGTTKGLWLWLRGQITQPVPLHEQVTTLLVDRRNALWAGTTTGLARIEGNTLHTFGRPEGFGRHRVAALGEDREGVLWVSTSRMLWRYSEGRFQQQPITGHVRDIHRDPEGTLWLTTGQGLYRRRGGRLDRFEIRTGPAEPRGLGPDPLHQVMSDDAGHLWLTGRIGVLRVSKRALDEHARGLRPHFEVMELATSDRGQGIDVSFFQPAGWRGHDGRLHFATGQGLISVDPARVNPNPLPPPVLLQNVVVDGRNVPATAPAAFPPGAGTLSFHYAGLSFQEPRKNRYRYRLEGLEDRWIEAGGRRAAFYTNLAPGRYRFRVQASNNDGVWNAAGASFSFTLAPHFYQTRAFFLACVAAALVLGGLLYRGRLRVLNSRYLAVLDERARLARELHDSLLQSMTAVWAQLAAVTRRLPDTAAARKELQAVQDLVSESLEETRHFVADLRGQERRQGDLGLALSRLVTRLSRAQTAACALEVTGEGPRLPQQVQSELFRIAQEALVNAFRHARANRIAVRLRHEADAVTLMVSDDGQGFCPPAAAEKPKEGHFGLLGVRERAIRIGATLSIDSEPGQGTTVTVVWSRGREHDLHG